jgi:hypothetical protein
MGVALLPANKRSFELNLDEFFSAEDTGAFTLSFHGVLPSIIDPAKQIEFTTPDLLITIAPASPAATNAPTNSIPDGKRR